MNPSTRTQAVLLLTASFTKQAKGDPKPLNPTEWGRFAQWLNEHGVAPEDLLTTDNPMHLLYGGLDRSITPERIVYLLGRSAALGLALEKWQRVGLWVIVRSDKDYPSRLRKRLKSIAPPVLFGCGHRQLLDNGGIAVIGSREASADDLSFTSRLGGDFALQGCSVVSGGARGVDEAAMLGALDKEGTVIGVLADSLLRASTSAKYRKGLMANNLVLVSPFNPEVGFDVGNAMARNKYVYCLADAAIVVSTGKEKGGTWSGAIENLRQSWVPLWVKPNPDASSGNAALVERGGRWLPEGLPDVGTLIANGDTTRSDLPTANLFDYSAAISPDPGQPDEAIIQTECGPIGTEETAPTGETKSLCYVENREVDPHLEALSLYELFLIKLRHETELSPQSPEALQHILSVTKTQLNVWLEQAVSDGKVIKLNKPLRYRISLMGQGKLDL